MGGAQYASQGVGVGGGAGVSGARVAGAFGGAASVGEGGMGVPVAANTLGA
jgi:hypothetical protein